MGQFSMQCIYINIISLDRGLKVKRW